MKNLVAAVTLPLAVMACLLAAPAPGEPASADVHRFKIGTLDAIALKDGDITVPNDGKTVGLDQSPAAVAAVLTAAGLPAETITFSIQPLLVESGARTLLFDTGAGSASFAVAGRLPTSLQSAGVEPSQITDIFISHAHPDHVGGLVNDHGALAFPNATIHVSVREWDSMKSKAKSDAGIASLVAKIAPHVSTFQPGTEIVPGVEGVAIYGHTPGHCGYMISSDGGKLFYIGDSAHHSIISVQHPDWKIDFDEDQAMALSARRAVLQRAANENLRVYAVHFPFPGIGLIHKQGKAFVWVPE